MDQPGSVSMGLEGVSVGVVLRDTCFISSTTKKSGQLLRNYTPRHRYIIPYYIAVSLMEHLMNGPKLFLKSLVPGHSCLVLHGLKEIEDYYGEGDEGGREGGRERWRGEREEGGRREGGGREEGGGEGRGGREEKREERRREILVQVIED